jgi:hypothetical protein
MEEGLLGIPPLTVACRLDFVCVGLVVRAREFEPPQGKSFVCVRRKHLGKSVLRGRICLSSLNADSGT